MCQLVTTLLLTRFLFGTVGADSSLGDEYPEVQISSGLIKGIKMASFWTNQTFYAFRGVPYAAPPIGDLRFKDPIHPMKWTAVKDCTSEQSTCFQPSFLLQTDEEEIHNDMSEDCLYLNVYSPELVPAGSLLPVLVWVHGGSFIIGSGNYISAGPDWLLAEGVVVVTCNYRLGAFGFLSLGTSDASGNSGLKDQRLALLWVQKEINKFGGDPARVTLFGESAGAAAVHLHYLSPLSVGLFQQAIADSGTALESWAARENNTERGLQLAKDLNCDVTELSLALDCLRAVNATAVLAAQSKGGGSNGLSPEFIPTVDRFSDSPFLPEMPELLLKKRQGSFVPFLMGTNRNEGALGLSVGEEKIHKIKDNLSPLIPNQFKRSCSVKQMKDLEQRVSNFYFKGSTPSYSNIRGLLDLYSDAFFSYSTARSAKHLRTRGKVYLYYFTFDGIFKDPSVLHYGHLLNTSLVSHGEELNYLFVIKSINQTAEDDSAETITRKRMVRMWTNFVKFGDPANGSDALLQMVTWLPLDNVSTRHFNIDFNLTMNHSDYLNKRILFWDSLVASTAQPLKLYYSIIITSLVTLIKVK